MGDERPSEYEWAKYPANVRPDYSPRPPSKPTELIGKAKVRVLAERLSRGEELWHPQDRAE